MGNDLNCIKAFEYRSYVEIIKLFDFGRKFHSCLFSKLSDINQGIHNYAVQNTKKLRVFSVFRKSLSRKTEKKFQFCVSRTMLWTHSFFRIVSLRAKFDLRLKKTFENLKLRKIFVVVIKKMLVIHFPNMKIRWLASFDKMFSVLFSTRHRFLCQSKKKFFENSMIPFSKMYENCMRSIFYRISLLFEILWLAFVCIWRSNGAIEQLFDKVTP